MSGTTSQKGLLLWPEQEVLHGYSWAQRTQKAPRADEDIDRKKEDHSFELTAAERTEKKNSGRQMAMHT